MSDATVEGIEPIIDFTKPPKNAREPVIDFTGERRAAPKKVQEKKKSRGVVGSRNESALSRMAKAKSLRLALAALGAAGAIKSLATSDSNADVGESSAIVSQLPKEDDKTALELEEREPGHFDVIFHDLNPEEYQRTRETVDDFKNRIAAKSNYIDVHRNIPLEYRHTIEQTAKMYGISVDTLMGIISVENGGGPAVTNESSGAMGVAQFLPDTARQYGLLVNEEFDERGNPLKSIPAAGRYLEVHKDLFEGDEGLAVWSYHAGVGNVFNALRVYYLDKYNYDIGDYVGAIVANDAGAREDVEENLEDMMEKDKTDVSKVLFNEEVQEEVVKHLDDYSGSYVFAVAAAGELLHEYNSQDNKNLAAMPKTSR